MLSERYGVPLVRSFILALVELVLGVYTLVVAAGLSHVLATPGVAVLLASGLCFLLRTATRSARFIWAVLESDERTRNGGPYAGDTLRHPLFWLELMCHLALLGIVTTTVLVGSDVYASTFGHVRCGHARITQPESRSICVLFSFSLTYLIGNSVWTLLSVLGYAFVHRCGRTTDARTRYVHYCPSPPLAFVHWVVLASGARAGSELDYFGPVDEDDETGLTKA